MMLSGIRWRQCSDCPRQFLVLEESKLGEKEPDPVILRNLERQKEQLYAMGYLK